jgi:hypothetical protein
VAVALRRAASRVLGRVSAPGAMVAQWMQDTERSNAERSWRLSPEFGAMSVESAISASQAFLHTVLSRNFVTC